jgi:hypothetical protein
MSYASWYYPWMTQRILTGVDQLANSLKDKEELLGKTRFTKGQLRAIVEMLDYKYLGRLISLERASHENLQFTQGEISAILELRELFADSAKFLGDDENELDE